MLNNLMYVKKSNLAIQEVDNNIIVFEPMTKTYNVLNQIAKDILMNCDGDHNVESIINLISDSYNNENRNDIERDVYECMEALENLGIIELKTGA